MSLPFFANSLWYASTWSDAWQHHQALRNVAQTQEKLLLSMIRANEKTVFGREHSFEKIQSAQDFQKTVPLMDYDDYAPYIERIKQGEQNILTQEAITLLEPTSGSTSATKLIPYTASLKQQFNRGIAPWITNLFTHYPHLMRGQAYWSVSPIDSQKRYTEGGIPIGFDDDTDYLGSGGFLLKRILAVPNIVKLMSNMDNFRYVSLLFLLHSENLRLISVWNPSFMTILLEHLPQWSEQLVRDIADGTVTPPAELENAVKSAIESQLKANPERAKVIESALSHDAATCHRMIWDKLGLVSCWADGEARYQAEHLTRLLPHATLQGKGLIATEAFVSFPVIGSDGSQLAIRSHFLEFISESGKIHLAHQLIKGEQYQLVVTTGGGLYRYQLHDLVESCGDLHIRFIGRSANISDHFGEKVSEGHVRAILEALYSERPSFTVLSPEMYEDGTTAYTLFTEKSVSAEQLEAQLSENYHYAYCRRLKQLAHAKVIVVDKNAPERYLAACVKRGQRSGDVKPTILYKHGGLLPDMLD